MAEGERRPAGPERCRVGWRGTQRNQPSGEHMGGHQETHCRKVLYRRIKDLFELFPFVHVLINSMLFKFV